MSIHIKAGMVPAEINGETNMMTITITRKQYNTAIDSYPKFMATEYTKCKRDWNLSGVTVTGKAETISKLASLTA